jgi:hypothetical protein
MIFIYFVVAVILFLGAVGYWGIDFAFNAVLDNLETKWPSYYSGSGPDTLIAFIHWMPVLCIMIPIIIYVIVNSQKPQEIYE